MDVITPQRRLLRDLLFAVHCCQPVTSCPLQLPKPTIGREDLGMLINHTGVRAGALRRARDVDGQALPSADASPNRAKRLGLVLGTSVGSRGHLGTASGPSAGVTENCWMASPGSILPPMLGLAGTCQAPVMRRWEPEKLLRSFLHSTILHRKELGGS